MRPFKRRYESGFHWLSAPRSYARHKNLLPSSLVVKKKSQEMWQGTENQNNNTRIRGERCSPFPDVPDVFWFGWSLFFETFFFEMGWIFLNIIMPKSASLVLFFLELFSFPTKNKQSRKDFMDSRVTVDSWEPRFIFCMTVDSISFSTYLSSSVSLL